MARQLSNDYASYIVNNNISKEITPILSTTDTIQTRMNEIESIFLPTIRHDTEMAKENITHILDYKSEFDKICNQIDNLESMIEQIKTDINTVQKQVFIAEEELDIPEKKIDIILKSINIFAKPRDVNETNWNHDGFYEAPKIFNTDDFFPKSQDPEN